VWQGRAGNCAPYADSLSNVGSIDAGDVPLDKHAASPFVLATLAYLAAAKATGCIGH
jgi:hypothetical protein